MILIFWKQPNYSLYIQGTKYCGNICFIKIPHKECANFSTSIYFPVNLFKSHTILLTGWSRMTHLTSPFVCLVDFHQLWWHIWIMENCLNLAKWLQAIELQFADSTQTLALLPWIIPLMQPLSTSSRIPTSPRAWYLCKEHWHNI